MSYPAISLATATAYRHRRPPKRLQTARQPPIHPNSSPDHRFCNFLTPLPLSSRCLSVSTGGFGLDRNGLSNVFLESFVDTNIKDLTILFQDLNSGAHGSAGKFTLEQLRVIKTRVEDAIDFVCEVAS